MSCTVVAISQCLERGDSDSFDIIIPNRDLTGAPNTTIWFTAKQNKTLTTQREISRSNKDITYPLVIAYNNPDTTITVPIISPIDIVNWVTTRDFLNNAPLFVLVRSPFNTDIGWNADKKNAG